MFTPSQLEQMPKEIEKYMSGLEMRIMEDVVRRIKINGEITRSADWQIYRLSELADSDKQIRKYIQETLKLSDAEVNKLFDDVIPTGYAHDESLYTAAGKIWTPYAENTALQQTVEALKHQTMDELQNITQSMGFAVDSAGNRTFRGYQDVLDQAMMDISSGAFDYESTIKRTIGQMTRSGIRTISYDTGMTTRSIVAARRAVMTGVTQVTNKINEQNAEDLDTEWFEVTWHGTARPSHQEWQGRVYTKEQLVSVCGLGTAGGLGGANCRHSYFTFLPGISERTYTDEELDEMNAKENEPRDYMGQKYTAYEASQRQRYLERTMRAERQKIKLLEEAGASEDDIMIAKCRYQGTQQEYVRFSKAMELPQEMQRVYADGLGKVNSGRIKKSVTETGKGDIISGAISGARNPYGKAAMRLRELIKEKSIPKEQSVIWY